MKNKSRGKRSLQHPPKVVTSQAQYNKYAPTFIPKELWDDYYLHMRVLIKREEELFQFKNLRLSKANTIVKSMQKNINKKLKRKK